MTSSSLGEGRPKDDGGVARKGQRWDGGVGSIIPSLLRQAVVCFPCSGVIIATLPANGMRDSTESVSESYTERWLFPNWICRKTTHPYIDIQGIQQRLLSEATYNKYICQKKVKQYIAVSTVRMIIEPSAKHQHTTQLSTITKFIPWSGGILDSDWLQGVH